MNKILNTLLFAIIVFSQNLIAQESDNFYEPHSIRSFKISFEQENWMELLDSLRLYGDGLLIGNIEIDGAKYEDVGIRWRGSKSFVVGAKHNALHIALNYIDKNQNHQGYKKLKLSAALRDPSMVREVLGFQIARKYMPAPEANYANVSINGNLYGLFVNVEDVDEHFLENHFGSGENSFFKCTPVDSKNKIISKDCKNNLFASLEYEEKASCYPNNFEMKSDDGWDDLIELTRVLNKDVEKIESVLNVDRTLWMLAFNNVLANLSSYTGFNSQNYYLYKDDKGQFNPILWDLNLAFGSFKTVGAKSDLTLKELQRLDPLLHADNELKPLISKLLSVPLYKKIYLNHIRTIVYDNFENDWYEKEIEVLQSVIKNDLAKDVNKEYTDDEFQKSLTTTIGKRSKIPGIKELMSKRSKYLKKHPEVSVFPPTVEEVTVVGREKFSNEIVKDFKIMAKVEKRAKRVILYYRYDPGETYKEVFMADDGKSNDEEAGDKIFGVTISPSAGQEKIEYFILAENIAAVGFSPANYMYEPYTSSFEELNK
jgi:CotH protein